MKKPWGNGGVFFGQGTTSFHFVRLDQHHTIEAMTELRVIGNAVFPLRSQSIKE